MKQYNTSHVVSFTGTGCQVYSVAEKKYVKTTLALLRDNLKVAFLKFSIFPMNKETMSKKDFAKVFKEIARN